MSFGLTAGGGAGPETCLWDGGGRAHQEGGNGGNQRQIQLVRLEQLQPIPVPLSAMVTLAGDD